MNAKRGGLGRNLSALLTQTNLSTTKNTLDTPVQLVACALLQPGQYQPRSDVNETNLQELAESIKKQGLLQPLIVREIAPQRYEIIAGERRWRACQLAGLETIPIIVRQVDDETAMAMALVENIQREDLNAIDQARAMQRLNSEFDLTHQQIADLLSKSRTAVSNFLRLLQLSPDVKRMVECHDLEMGHARCLLVLDEQQQSEIAQLIVAKNLSVRETESLVARIKMGTTATIHKTAAPIPLYVTELLQTLTHRLQMPIKLQPNKKGQGKLILHYKNEDDLTALMQRLADIE